MHPGDVWRDLLVTSGLSQAMVARQVGISAKHLNQILQGKALPSAQVVLALSKALDVPDTMMWQLQATYVLELARSKATL